MFSFNIIEVFLLCFSFIYDPTITPENVENSMQKLLSRIDVFFVRKFRVLSVGSAPTLILLMNCGRWHQSFSRCFFALKLKLSQGSAPILLAASFSRKGMDTDLIVYGSYFGSTVQIYIAVLFFSCSSVSPSIHKRLVLHGIFLFSLFAVKLLFVLTFFTSIVNLSFSFCLNSNNGVNCNFYQKLLLHKLETFTSVSNDAYCLSIFDAVACFYFQWTLQPFSSEL